MNHIAPLFANFDTNGAYTAAIAVVLPTDGMPTAVRADYLPAADHRVAHGQAGRRPGALGAAMAADPRRRAGARSPASGTGRSARATSWRRSRWCRREVIADQVAAFDAGGHKLRDLFFTVFTSDDFMKF